MIEMFVNTSTSPAPVAFSPGQEPTALIDRGTAACCLSECQAALSPIRERGAGTTARRGRRACPECRLLDTRAG